MNLILRRSNMSYIKADQVLPSEIVKLLQEYVDGLYIYIPRKINSRCKWGENTQIGKELHTRNNCIYDDYLNGYKTSELATKYYLSEKSIQRIIKKMKNLQ